LRLVSPLKAFAHDQLASRSPHVLGNSLVMSSDVCVSLRLAVSMLKPC
jgi:hypothetical protein